MSRFVVIGRSPLTRGWVAAGPFPDSKAGLDAVDTLRFQGWREVELVALDDRLFTDLAAQATPEVTGG